MEHSAMRLSSANASVWQMRATAVAQKKFPRLSAEALRESGGEHFDVCIVGGGITGLTCAMQLKRSGKRVAVVEAMEVGSGSTGRSTGHLTTMLDCKFASVESNMGHDQAVLVHKSMVEAINLIEHNCETLKLDCDFQRLDGILYAEANQDSSEVEKEYEAMQRVGFRGVQYIDKLPDLNINAKKAILLSNQAQFNPFMYCRELASHIHGNGCVVFEHSRVTEMDVNAEMPRVKANGTDLHCSRLVLATNGPIGLFPTVQTRIYGFRSYVAAIKVPGNSITRPRLYWDVDNPYNYTRSYSGKDLNTLIIGGFDHKTGEPGKGGEQEHVDGLRRYIKERYPQHEELACWSAQSFSTGDELPFIGLLPNHKNVFIGTGYEGDGLVFGTVAAKMIADLIVEGKSDYTDLYIPSRIRPVKGAGKFLKEQVKVGAHFVADRFHADAESMADIAKGCGALVQDGGRQMAVYRDDKGNLHIRSAVCTHMKCTVKFNNHEKTWDCPCHASRFDVDGNVLEGPAMIELEDLGSHYKRSEE